jgi:hypothetical protein
VHPNEENLSGMEELVSVCAGLVTVDEESTQRYFERICLTRFPDAKEKIATLVLPTSYSISSKGV